MRFLIVGDLRGPEYYHVGDEAMASSNVRGLKARFPGCDIALVSKDPSFTARRHDARAIRALPFPERPADPGEPARIARDLLREGLKGKGRAGPLAEALPALEDSQALLISGGGNLNSLFPDHLYQRAVWIHTARRLGKKVLLVGQGLGPLSALSHEAALRAALRAADLVGVRDEASRGLAESLGVDPRAVFAGIDDAFFLAPEPVDPARTPPEFRDAGGGWIGLSLHAAAFPAGNHALEALAAALDAVRAETGARFLFIPHAFAAPGSPYRGDAELGARIRPLLRDPESLAVPEGLFLDGEVRWLTARMGLVLASRYHALVFAAGEGVPCLAIGTDPYCRQKSEGLLRTIGASGSLLDPARQGPQEIAGKIVEAWRSREETAKRLAERLLALRILDAEKWRRLAEALCGKKPAARARPSLLRPPPPLRRPSLPRRILGRLRSLLRLHMLVDRARADVREAIRSQSLAVRALEEEIHRLREEIQMNRRALKGILLEGIRCRRLSEEALVRIWGEPADETEETPAFAAARPQVTVGIPACNYERFIRGCLESVLGSRGVDLECIVVDDHSVDGTAAEVQEIARKNPGFPLRLVRRRANRGLPAARNLIFRMARAGSVFLLDADNLILPETLRALLDALEATGADFAYPIIEKFDAKGTCGFLSDRPWDPCSLREANYIDAMALVRKSAWEKAGGYSEELELYGVEDYAFWLACAERGLRGAWVERVLARYRVHPTSMISTSGLDVVAIRWYLARKFRDMEEE